MEKYVDLIQIGEGSYANVFRARDKHTNKIVAIKKMNIGKDGGFPRSTIREIKMLKGLNYKHCVHAIDCKFEDKTFYLVLEYMSFDLYGIIQSKIVIDNQLFRSILFQLILAVNHIHKLGYVHRDIKSSNVLIDRSGLVKLGDFGLTREVSDCMTNNVCTLWYRAPELLLGDENYSYAVDSWSIGIIMLEMKLKRVPFCAHDEIGQIKKIFSQLGTPDSSYTWSKVFEQPNYRKEETLEKLVETNYGRLFLKDELNILCGLLSLNPHKRILPSVIVDENLLGNNEKLIPIDHLDVHEFYSLRKPADLYKDCA